MVDQTPAERRPLLQLLAILLAHDHVPARRWACAIGAGSLCALAQAPLHLVPLFFFGICLFVWQLVTPIPAKGRVPGNGRPIPRARRALAIGWFFGFGYFLTGIHWIGHSFFVDAERFALLAIPAVIGLCAGLALFFMVAAWIIARFGAPGWRGALVLALAWVAMDWLRGVILTGFPWNLAGHIWGEIPAMLQMTAFSGIHGLGLLTCLLAGALTMTGYRRRPGDRYAGILILLAFFLVFLGGAARLAGAPGPEPKGTEGLVVRLVQPNIAQRDKWRQDLRGTFLNRLLEMTSRDSEGKAPGIVIWPETAVTYDLERDLALRKALGRASPAVALITGALRIGEPLADGRRDLWNSLFVIGSSGAILAVYDKAHLVPFGEYTPGWAPVRQLASLPAGLKPGPGPVVLRPPGIPSFAPLICYEAIFSGHVILRQKPRPDWLVNITNDAWFGDSFGPRQHFLSARLRAIEEGLPLARVANTGISAMVDPYGQVRGRLELGKQGILDVTLPAKLAPTPFVRWGEWPLVLAMVFLGAGVAFSCWRQGQAG